MIKDVFTDSGLSVSELAKARKDLDSTDFSQQDWDRHWMQKALDLADVAEREGEVPVGAVVVRDNVLLGCGYNRPVSTNDPSAHAEIEALRAAAQAVGNYRLPSATLYVTLEPCCMCCGALIHSRIERLVFSTREPRAGAVLSHLHLLNQDIFNHRIACCEGILAEDSANKLRQFFRQRRQQQKAERLAQKGQLEAD